MGKKQKLIYKTFQGFLIFGIIAIIISSIALFFITQYILKDEIEDDLNSTLFRIEEQLEKGEQVQSLYPIIEITEVNKMLEQSIKDTLLYDPMEQEDELFKELTSYKIVQNKRYKIVVRTGVVESEDILIAILVSYIGIVAFIFLSQYFLGQRNTKIVWKPFFNNLENIKDFSLQANKPIQLEESNILEFYELNHEIKSLTNKVISDYKNLKQFTQDVSHEIQTPLAIIQAKIGNLLDRNNLNEKQLDIVLSIQNNCRRLASLNKKLILLTKIENQQFYANQKVELNEMVKKSIQNFEELSGIPISFTEQEKIQLQIDPFLVQTLVDNLISNAIKYADEKQQINVQIQTNELIVSNSGKASIQSPEKLFNRFYKEQGNESLGLGLSIVHKVCELYNYIIKYQFKNSQHKFIIQFNPNSALELRNEN